MTSSIAIVVALVAVWLLWPRVVRYLWRRRRVNPTATTVLVVARAPTISGLALLAFGASPLVVLLVAGLIAVGGVLLFPYVRAFLSDPRTT